MVSDEVCILKYLGHFSPFCVFLAWNMASFGRGRGIRMSDVRGFKPGVLTRYSRYDYNICCTWRA